MSPEAERLAGAAARCVHAAAEVLRPVVERHGRDVEVDIEREVRLRSTLEAGDQVPDDHVVLCILTPGAGELECLDPEVPRFRLRLVATLVAVPVVEAPLGRTWCARFVDWAGGEEDVIPRLRAATDAIGDDYMEAVEEAVRGGWDEDPREPVPC